jgi:hypothetical protein
MTVLPEHLREQIRRDGAAHEVPDMPAGTVGYVIYAQLDLPQGPRFGAFGVAYLEVDRERVLTLTVTEPYDYVAYATEALRVAARRGMPAVIAALPPEDRDHPSLIDEIDRRQGQLLDDPRRLAAEISAAIGETRAQARAEGRA